MDLRDGLFQEYSFPNQKKQIVVNTKKKTMRVSLEMLGFTYIAYRKQQFD